ncbi:MULTISPECIES: hypothetical protein [unclassified Neisseria]|uniref:hypothetical protein n=1 Tax=unclassified Neisseria TaxID=2623750 RepID=UPI00107248E5|nr:MULTISPECIES: hypothetical protein [unclassified Neisseria]MBF0804661.1 hypothetical protein [Neisseria sp. 19428wB4_WF04]TFU40329.1 hypothetical protein E4T99_09965 [Neisseria sp. WF04]
MPHAHRHGSITHHCTCHPRSSSAGRQIIFRSAKHIAHQTQANGLGQAGKPQPFPGRRMADAETGRKLPIVALHLTTAFNRPIVSAPLKCPQVCTENTAAPPHRQKSDTCR